MAKRAHRNKEAVKDVLLIAGGGLTEMVIETLVDSYAPQYNIIPGVSPYNVGDVIGAMEALVLTAVGVYKDKPKAVMLGAGGLAVAVPNLVAKVIVNFMPVTTTRLGGSSYTNSSMGKYGRNVHLEPAKFVPSRYRR